MLAATGSRGLSQTIQSSANPAPDGQALIAQAAAQLMKIPALEAKLRQTTFWFDQELAGAGSYFQSQSPRGLLLRLELKLSGSDQPSSLQQVCDGRFLWIRRDLPSGVSLGRVDLERMREAVSEKGPPTWAGAAASTLAVGGLPQLLAALAENFQFAAAQPLRSDKATFWATAGVWKPDRLAALLPDQKDRLLAGGPVDPGQLPTQLPSEVYVVLSQKDLLPHRIEYRRAREGQTAMAGRTPPTMVLEILEIQRRDALDENLFSYEPGKQEVVDFTERYLQSLHLSPARP
jgi:hypothetical protein